MPTWDSNHFLLSFSFFHVTYSLTSARSPVPLQFIFTPSLNVVNNLFHCFFNLTFSQLLNFEKMQKSALFSPVVREWRFARDNFTSSTSPSSPRQAWQSNRFSYWSLVFSFSHTLQMFQKFPPSLKCLSAFSAPYSCFQWVVWILTALQK